MLQAIGRGLANRGLRRDGVADLCQLPLQIIHQGCTLGLAHRQPLDIAQATDTLLHLIDLGDPAQDLERRRRLGRLEHVRKLAPGMSKAEGKLERGGVALATLLGHGLVSAKPIYLENAGKAAQMRQ